jgi:hypothetical protein
VVSDANVYSWEDGPATFSGPSWFWSDDGSKFRINVFLIERWLSGYQVSHTFCQPVQAIDVIQPRLSHDWFLPNPFLVNLHRCCLVWDTDVMKWATKGKNRWVDNGRYVRQDTDIVPTLEQNLKTEYGQLGDSDRKKKKINDKTKSCYYYFFTLPFLCVRDKVRKCSW